MMFNTFCTILLIKFFLDYIKGRCTSRKRLDGKTVLITGGASGIGKETAKDLAKRGARILIVDKNYESALIAQNEIVKETNNKNVIIKKTDMGSFESIRMLAKDLSKTEEQIDILIHNAGIGPTQKKSLDNIRLTYAVYLYGPFLLTHLLLDLIKKSNNSRIIFVSSTLAIGGIVDFNNIGPDGSIVNKPLSYSYCITKYGLILLTKMFKKRLKNIPVTVNAVHPGLVSETNIFKPYTIVSAILKILHIFTKTHEEGAQTSIYATVDDLSGQVSGMFFIDCYKFNVFNSEKHNKNGKILWRKCEEIVKLNEFETKI